MKKLFATALLAGFAQKADAYSLQSNKLANKKMASGVHVSYTEFADGSAGITKSIGELSTYHELMNYMYPESVQSEESPANSTSGAVSINDPLSVQYKMDLDKAKFQNGWFTGEASDLRTEVPSFTSNNLTNILQIK